VVEDVEGLDQQPVVAPAPQPAEAGGGGPPLVADGLCGVGLVETVPKRGQVLVVAVRGAGCVQCGVMLVRGE